MLGNPLSKMVNIYDQPDEDIPDEPATFSIPSCCRPLPKTMLEELWENEPFPDIPGREPEEAPDVNKDWNDGEMSSDEGFLSEDVDREWTPPQPGNKESSQRPLVELSANLQLPRKSVPSIAEDKETVCDENAPGKAGENSSPQAEVLKPRNN